MTCDDARRLISLYRPGERTEKETSMLEEHLHSCDACRDVADEMRPTSQAMGRLRLREPVLRDHNQFTYQVMSNIAAGESGQPQTWIDVLLMPAHYPSVRLGLAAVVLTALVTLGAQTCQTLRDAHDIEQRFAYQSGLSRKEHVKFEIDISHVPVTKKQKEALREVGVITEANAQFLISDQLLDIIRSVLERPTIQSQMLPGLSEHLDLNSLARKLKPHLRARLF